MLPRNGDPNRLHFYVQPRISGLLVKAYVPAESGLKEPPSVLRCMRSALMSNSDLSELRERFPEDAGMILAIKDAVAMGTVLPESISTVLWREEYGHVLEFQMKIQPN